MRYAASAGTAFLNLSYSLSTQICLKTGGLPVKARPERAASPAARLGRKRSAKTSTWPSTAPVSAPLTASTADLLVFMLYLKQNQKNPILQFLTSWMWFLMRRLFSSLRLNGKLLCSSVSITQFSNQQSHIKQWALVQFFSQFVILIKISDFRCTWCRQEAHKKCFVDQVPWEVLLPCTTWVDTPIFRRMAVVLSGHSFAESSWLPRRHHQTPAKGRGPRRRVLLHLQRRYDQGHLCKWATGVWQFSGIHVWHQNRKHPQDPRAGQNRSAGCGAAGQSADQRQCKI